VDTTIFSDFWALRWALHSAQANIGTRMKQSWYYNLLNTNLMAYIDSKISPVIQTDRQTDLT